MEKIVENRNNCYNFSTIGNQTIVDWTRDNSTVDVLEVNSYTYIPVIFYNKINETDYQWCGPLLRIAEHFAKTIKVKYKILS